MELIQACHTGRFPSIGTMCSYGLSGYSTTNPLAVFECYKKAIKYDGITAEQLNDAMERGALTELVMESPSVQVSPLYQEVMGRGGIQPPPKTLVDCHVCGSHGCRIHKNTLCEM
jgi:hypothetical protein